MRGVFKVSNDAGEVYSVQVVNDVRHCLPMPLREYEALGLKPDLDTLDVIHQDRVSEELAQRT